MSLRFNIDVMRYIHGGPGAYYIIGEDAKGNDIGAGYFFRRRDAVEYLTKHVQRYVDATFQVCDPETLDPSVDILSPPSFRPGPTNGR